MAAITFDDPTLNWPEELSKPENEPYRRIIERIVARIGGPANDTINTLTEATDTNSTSITSLSEAIEEIEELLAVQKQNLDTNVFKLKMQIKEEFELRETGR